uniref:Nuclear speckle splicing regulatory protein 1 N-terminal domain-containing protein n=1 Tax=Megaselia scalaris TaxID=36166 RepID=T1GMN3_MEGSC
MGRLNGRNATQSDTEMTEDKPEENKIRYRRLEKMVSEDHSSSSSTSSSNGNGNGKDDKRYRRTQSVTRAEDIKTKEEKQRQSQPDKPIHRPRDSLFSWSSGFDNFTGFVNWAFLLLSIGGLRLCLENLLKRSDSNYDLFDAGERNGNELIPENIGMISQATNIMAIVFLPVAIIHVKSENFSLSKYGLIIPGQKPKEKPPPQKASVFGESSSDSDDDAPKFMERKKGPTMGPGMAEARRARLLQEKALEEDPTVFQYDEHFDEMEAKRNEVKEAKKKEVKKAKYINRLLEFADKRKIENERRIERQVQKEREAEGEEFKDKESFVTSAYRKKLEELRKAEEEEKREEYLESIGDVTKQRNLDGFYRHIFEQKTSEDSEKKTDEPKYVPIRSQKSDKKPEAKVRSYRKHHSSDDEKEAAKSESEEPAKSEDEEKENKKSEKEDPVKKDAIPASEEPKKAKKDEETFKVPQVLEKEEEEKPKPKPKIDKSLIWKKRTVGEVFDAAVQRYYERKAARA